MSTFILAAPPLDASRHDGSSLSEAFATLVQYREAAAERSVARHLGSQTDARLKKLGFSEGDIAALRAGRMQFPAR